MVLVSELAALNCRMGDGMMITSETKTYTIGRVGLEASQRSYIVTMERKGAGKGDIASYPYGPNDTSARLAYNAASLAVTSIKRGRFVCRRGEWQIIVSGRKLTATR